MLTFAENPYTNLQSILLFHQLRRHGRDQKGQSLPGARGRSRHYVLSRHGWGMVSLASDEDV
jgi:hypothetical protein